MKRAAIVLAVLAVSVSFGLGLVGPDLEAQIAVTGSSHRIPVIIALNEQADAAQLSASVDGMARQARRVDIARTLRDWSAEQQADLMAFLAGLEAEGQVCGVGQLWLVNAVYCNATEAAVRAIVQHPDVWYVDADVKYVPDLLPAVAPGDATTGSQEQAIAWGVRKVNAPDVWDQGYRGQGIVVGVIDTGVDYNHHDLRDHMWTDPNYPLHGWNFENNSNDPMDASGHGTHCAGSVASDGSAGTICGVAPEAEIMALRVRTQADSLAETQVWAAMEFVVSPPLSPDNGGDIITMSLGWRNAWNPMRKLWRDGCNNVGAAGVTMIVAAGNEQSSSPPYSCRTPGDVPPPWWNPENVGTGALSNVISIGATDSFDVIASFSSRGPVEWGTVAGYSDYPHPPGLTRPDVSAPGVSVLSCRRNDPTGYTTMSGTSMATPHTAGVAALMLSKNYELLPPVVDSILEITALDLGSPGKDMYYGAGRIDALEAVDAVGDPGGPARLQLREVLVHDPPPGGNDNGRFDPGETADIIVTLRNIGGEDAENVTAVLRSGHPLFTIDDPDGSFGDIPRGEQRNNSADPFTATASSAIPNNTSVTCTLHVSSDTDGEWTLVFTLVVGRPPGLYIVWGPRALSGFPTSGFPYGMAYNPVDERLYVTNAYSRSIYIYSSDENLSFIGTVPAPDTLLTDLAWCGYDSTFWVAADFTSAGRRVYKMKPDGTVLRQFNNPANDYPTGVAWVQAERELYFSDRRTSANTFPQYVYAADTLGATLRRMDVPLQANYGPRCLAFEPSGPGGGSLLLVYTSFNTGGTSLDSAGLYELRRDDLEIVQRVLFPGWNARGVAYDPRDGNYWISSVSSPDNSVIKVEGFYGPPTGIEGPSPAPVADRLGQLSVSPNPGSEQVRLSYSLPAAGRVRVSVCDLAGRVVTVLADEVQGPGQHTLAWDGRSEDGGRLAGGIYFFRLEASGESRVGRFVLLR